MVKRIDVDTLLAENQLELTLGGHSYVLKDIPLDVFLSATKEVDKEDVDRDVLHRQLSEILGIDKSELGIVGLKAATLAINAIRDWILEETPEGAPKGKGGEGKASRP